MTTLARSAPEMIDWIDGQPYSQRFGDVYFSRASGIDETHHVFLDGNRLTERFSGLAARANFVIGETGFGTGLNFLCAWRLFHQVATPEAQLHFVSTELFPLSAQDLGHALALWPELEPYAAALLAQWDELAPGWQRFVFADGRVTLTLLIGDARETLPQLDAEVDAWFLDGFSPAKNPELWTPALMQTISQCSRPGTTFATYSSAGDVRRALEAAGFRPEKVRGFGPKREMLRGECVAPVAQPYRAPWLERPRRTTAPRDAIVIGGGLAGTAAASSLAARGVHVTLLERHSALAAEASGNTQGVLYAKLSPHDTALSRLLVAGYQFSLREIGRLLPEDRMSWSRCGVLQLAHDETEMIRQRLFAGQGWPRSFLRSVDVIEAGAIAGVELHRGGLYFERGGWVHPPALCEAFARHACIAIMPMREALRIDRLESGGWRVSSANGWTADAGLVVLATAADTRAFAVSAHLPTHVIRGQLTQLPQVDMSARLATVLCGDGYIAPARGGSHSLGATFGIRDPGTDVRGDDHRENLGLLRVLSPALADAFAETTRDLDRVDGRAALRCVAPDYLPVVGPMVDPAIFTHRFARLSKDATTRFAEEAPWLEGLFVSVAHGSRGLITAPIAGELIAAQAMGEPAPLARNVADALSPARFLARSLKRSTLVS